MIQSILVVCVGNICRSPMAEALLRNRAPEIVRLESAGLGALVGEGADPTALALMQDHGMNITDHRARQLTSQMVRKSDLILVMEKAHQQHFHSILPSSRGRVHRIGKWRDLDVPDPYKKSPEYFGYIFTLIEQGVDDWAKRLWS